MSEPVFPRRMWATYDEFTGWGICSNKPIRDWSKEVVAVDALRDAFPEEQRWRLDEALAAVPRTKRETDG